MRNAGAVLHTHSMNAVMVTLLFENEFRITHFEMIKGIVKGGGTNSPSLSYSDTLVVPIIENTNRESELTESLQEAIEAYPDTCAVLVRRHGVYIWGPTWEKTKTMAECFDYLFEVAVRTNKMGIDCSSVPGKL
eukprot:TRINITY_DN3686_c0_g1_i3.p1 TRINITY_DN3686_c0_g1~~TRINITY_DN3686_c0_g1_i3.p1  ORF type:complete len:134 (-),score=29.73 TRINITY_DN3686_c0_g1_i3:18-419(-)